MIKTIRRFKKYFFYALFLAELFALLAGCTKREQKSEPPVVTQQPVSVSQEQTQVSTTTTPIPPPLPEFKDLCVYLTVKDTSGQRLHVQDILRVAIVSKAGDELPAEPMGVSLIKVCPMELRDYLVDLLLTESKARRVFHATVPVSKDELKKQVSKDVSAHEETESLLIQGPATVETNSTVAYFASPKTGGYPHADLYNGVSAYFFYVSPKAAVKASQVSYDGLNIQTGSVGNLRLTIWCEAWSDTKGLLGYGVRTVLITDPVSPTGSATVTISKPLSLRDFFRVR